MTLSRLRRLRQDGQMLVLFALSLSVLCVLAGLLYTGAQALVVRRQLQNMSDAAALAGANLLVDTNGCSTGDGGTPYASIVSAAKAAITADNAVLPASNISVTCPTGYDNHAVQVNLKGRSPAYFVGSLDVATTATAINGYVFGEKFAVAVLDPSHPSWSGGGNRTGCASYTVNGGITVSYEGSIMIDSTCAPPGNQTGAVKALNNAFSMTMLNGARLLVAGTVDNGTLSAISPTPVQNYRPLLPDPLSGIVPPCHDTIDPTLTSCLGTTGPSGSLPTRKISSICTGANADPCILPPGTYTGGITAGGGSNPSILLLRPGVFFVAGGGVTLKSGSGRIVAIPSASGVCGITTATPAGVPCNDTNARATYNISDPALLADQWDRDCPGPTATSTPTCGVLIYNAKADNQSNWTTTGNNADAVSNGGQGDVLLRSYQPALDSLGEGSIFKSYENLVLWQARLPVPSATTWQPVVSMAGNGCVTLSGTVYAPGAEVDFGGTTCGSGGGAASALSLQFIVYDLTLAGNNNFYFAYHSDAFATPGTYGLVK